MRRKVIIGLIVFEHLLLVLWFCNALPGFRVKPPNRERRECEEEWGLDHGWNVIEHRWGCEESWVIWGIPGV